MSSVQPGEATTSRAPEQEARLADLDAALAALSGGALDAGRPLTASAQLRRRQAFSRLMEGTQTASALLAVALLAFVVYSVASRGASVLSLGFLVKGPPALEGQPGGGVGPEIVGTATLVAIAAAMATPVGILAALYMTEFAQQRIAQVVRLVLDLLYGTPTIVIGLFVFGLLVYGKRQSGFAGALGLSIIMLPLVARASQETLLLVPRGLREAAEALGVSRWRALRGVTLPSALGGIITGIVLAIARAAGETAPLLLTCSVFGRTISTSVLSEPTPNIPVYIFKASNGSDPYGFARAWGAALVLLGVILIANVGSRALHARSRAKLAR